MAEKRTIVRTINGERRKLTPREDSQLRRGVITREDLSDAPIQGRGSEKRQRTATEKIDSELSRSDVRRDVARDFARQVNLINQSFDAIQAQNVLDQKARVGETTALLASAGIAGSARGQAQQQLTREAGRQIAEQTEARRAESLLGVEQAIQQTAEQRFADEQSLLADQQTSQLISSQVQQGITDPAQVFRNLGGAVSFETIESFLPEVEQPRGFNLGRGQQRYEFNPATQQFELIASGAPIGGGSSGTGLSNDEVSLIASEIRKGGVNVTSFPQKERSRILAEKKKQDQEALKKSITTNPKAIADKLKDQGFSRSDIRDLRDINGIPLSEDEAKKIADSLSIGQQIQAFF